MKTITFHCETITPMFLAGADGTTPELRAPSIKGAMRFWWRAMNAGNYDTIAKLKQTESKIFGGTDDNSGRSKVVIKIISEQPSKEYIMIEKPLPHKQKGDKGFFEKHAIKPGFQFGIEICIHENPEVDIEKIKALFILVSFLSGIGNRSRRGFGCFKIYQIDHTNFNADLLEKYLFEEIEKVEKLNLESSLNYPYIKKIEVGSESVNVKDIGEITHYKKHEYGGPNNGFKYENSIGNSNPRFSSPIYVSIFQKSDGKLYPIITSLNTVPPNNQSFNTTTQEEFKKAILK